MTVCLKEINNLLLRNSIYSLDDMCRISNRNRIAWNILNHDRIAPNNNVIAYNDSRKNTHIFSNPYVVTYYDGAF